MKTISFNVCTFTELSEEAKKKAIEDNKNKVANILCESYGDDYECTIKELEEATHTKVKNWKVTWYGPYDFQLELDYDSQCIGEYEPELSSDIKGKLLYRYVYQHIIHNFIEPKTFYKGDKKRKSRITKISDWPIGGAWTENDFDNKLLDYYYHWNTYPEDYSLEDLMKDCWNAFFNQWENEMEYYFNNDDPIIEHMVINEWEFKEDGTLYNE